MSATSRRHKLPKGWPTLFTASCFLIVVIGLLSCPVVCSLSSGAVASTQILEHPPLNACSAAWDFGAQGSGPCRGAAHWQAQEQRPWLEPAVLMLDELQQIRGSKCKIAVLLVALLCVACGLFGQPWSLTCLARKAGLLPYLREAHARLGTLSWLSSRPGPERDPLYRAARRSPQDHPKQAQEPAQGPRRPRTPKHKLHVEPAARPAEQDSPGSGAQAPASAAAVLAHEHSVSSSGWSAEGVAEGRSPSPRHSIEAIRAGGVEGLSLEARSDSAENGWISVTPGARHRTPPASQQQAGHGQEPGGRDRKQGQAAKPAVKPAAASVAVGSPANPAVTALQTESSSVGPKAGAFSPVPAPPADEAKMGQGQGQTQGVRKQAPPQVPGSCPPGGARSPPGVQGSRRQARRQPHSSSERQVLPQGPKIDTSSGSSCSSSVCSEVGLLKDGAALGAALAAGAGAHQARRAGKQARGQAQGGQHSRSQRTSSGGKGKGGRGQQRHSPRPQPPAASGALSPAVSPAPAAPAAAGQLPASTLPLPRPWAQVAREAPAASPPQPPVQQQPNPLHSAPASLAAAGTGLGQASPLAVQVPSTILEQQEYRLPPSMPPPLSIFSPTVGQEGFSGGYEGVSRGYEGSSPALWSCPTSPVGPPLSPMHWDPAFPDLRHRSAPMEPFEGPAPAIPPPLAPPPPPPGTPRPRGFAGGFESIWSGAAEPCQGAADWSPSISAVWGTSTGFRLRPEEGGGTAQQPSTPRASSPARRQVSW